MVDLNRKNKLQDEIVLFLTKNIDGKSLDSIQQALSKPLETRTLQRRLRVLIDQGILESVGKGRATIYQLVSTRPKPLETNPLPEKNALIPLSEKGKEILDLVSLPIHKRNPVGYQRNFLESYNPNVSEYLSAEEKQQLSGIGVTAQINGPAGTYAKHILQRLLIDLAWNSSRLEGNTYSLLDTQLLLDKGLSSNDKTSAEAQMILNHKDAIEFIVNNPEDVGLNRYTILNLHGLLSNNLLSNAAASGRLREHGVGIGGSVYSPPAMPQFIEEMFNLMLYKANQIRDPFEQAFFMMVHVPYLQPFDDVNKRVSRLAANIPLNKNNLSPLSFTEVPTEIYINGLVGVYELNRIDLLKDVFIWAYNRSAKQYAAQRQSLGEPDPFRFKYREAIKQLLAEIIRKSYDKVDANNLIKERAETLPFEDRNDFIVTIEQELINLHEGNFARYFVTKTEFANWQKVWN